MNRRDFLRRAALVATGAIAADQLELLERLTHRRRFFPAADVSPFGKSDAESLVSYQDQHGRMWSGIITGVDTRRRTIDIDWGAGEALRIAPNDTIYLANGYTDRQFAVGDRIGILRA